MSVDALIELLQKVKTKEASVVVDGYSGLHEIENVVIQHDLKDDKVQVMIS